MTGADAEAYLASLFPGGQPQVRMATGIGRGATRFRIIDVLADGIAHESKVGYQRLSQEISTQIAKDAWLIRNGRIDGATWHFFRSGVTGKIGAAPELLGALERNGIKYVIHE